MNLPMSLHALHCDVVLPINVLLETAPSILLITSCLTSAYNLHELGDVGGLCPMQALAFDASVRSAPSTRHNCAGITPRVSSSNRSIRIDLFSARHRSRFSLAKGITRSVAMARGTRVTNTGPSSRVAIRAPAN